MNSTNLLYRFYVGHLEEEEIFQFLAEIHEGTGIYRSPSPCTETLH